MATLIRNSDPERIQDLIRHSEKHQLQQLLDENKLTKRDILYAMLECISADKLSVLELFWSRSRQCDGCRLMCHAIELHKIAAMEWLSHIEDAKNCLEKHIVATLSTSPFDTTLCSLVSHFMDLDSISIQVMESKQPCRPNVIDFLLQKGQRATIEAMMNVALRRRQLETVRHLVHHPLADEKLKSLVVEEGLKQNHLELALLCVRSTHGYDEQVLVMAVHQGSPQHVRDLLPRIPWSLKLHECVTWILTKNGNLQMFQIFLRQFKNIMEQQNLVDDYISIAKGNLLEELLQSCCIYWTEKVDSNLRSMPVDGATLVLRVVRTVDETQVQRAYDFLLFCALNSHISLLKVLLENRILTATDERLHNVIYSISDKAHAAPIISLLRDHFSFYLQSSVILVKAVCRAADANLVKVIQELLLIRDMRCDPDVYAAMHLAAEKAHWSVVECLVRMSGFDSQACNYCDIVAKSVAQRQFEVALRLLKAARLEKYELSSVMQSAHREKALFSYALGLYGSQAEPSIYAVLLAVVQKNNLEALKSLLQICGLTINETMYMALIVACQEGFVEIVQLLLRSFGDWNDSHELGVAIRCAAEIANYSCVLMLTRLDAVTVTADVEAAIVCLASNGQNVMLECLLKLPGQNMDCIHNAILGATENNHEVAVSILLSVKGVSASEKIYKAIETANQLPSLSLLQRLLSVPGVAAVESIYTAIQVACQKGLIPYLQELLQVNELQCCKEMYLSLLEATRQGNSDTLKMLLDKIAFEVDPHIYLSILDATQQNRLDLVQMLLQVKGLACNDSLIYEAILVATSSRNLEILQMLLSLEGVVANAWIYKSLVSAATSDSCLELLKLLLSSVDYIEPCDAFYEAIFQAVLADHLEGMTLLMGSGRSLIDHERIYDSIILVASEGKDLFLEPLLALHVSGSPAICQSIALAAKSQHTNIAFRLLQIDGLICDNKIYEAIVSCADSGNKVLLDALLKVSDLIVCDSIYEAIYVATVNNHVECVISLIQLPSIDANERLYDALCHASRKGDEALFGHLISVKGMKLSNQARLAEAMAVAAESGHLSVVERLAALVSIRTDRMYRAVLYVVQHGNNEPILSLLLMNAVSCDLIYESIVWCVHRGGVVPFLRQLLSVHGVQTHNDIYEALREAAIHQQKEELIWLLQVPGLEANTPFYDLLIDCQHHKEIYHLLKNMMPGYSGSRLDERRMERASSWQQPFLRVASIWRSMRRESRVAPIQVKEN